MKGILLLFVELYIPQAPGIQKSTFNPGLTIISLTVNGSLNMLYNNGIEGKDIWEEVSRLFAKTKK